MNITKQNPQKKRLQSLQKTFFKLFSIPKKKKLTNFIFYNKLRVKLHAIKNFNFCIIKIAAKCFNNVSNCAFMCISILNGYFKCTAI